MDNGQIIALDTPAALKASVGKDMALVNMIVMPMLFLSDPAQPAHLRRGRHPPHRTRLATSLIVRFSKMVVPGVHWGGWQVPVSVGGRGRDRGPCRLGAGRSQFRRTI